ncbi:MAG: hypothetical protein ABI581_00130 [Sediminibacterium sp.]
MKCHYRLGPRFFLIVPFIMLISFGGRLYAQGKSQWVWVNANGGLDYKLTERGDRIMDFSYAGYMGGGVALPRVPVKITLKPITGDNSDEIQQAVDSISAMPLVNGFRGAIFLESGTYECAKVININASGVVLSGSGSGENGTILNLTGKPHPCIVIKAAVKSSLVGKATTISDAYVPCAAISFHLTDPSVFSVGDTIRITRPVTDAWVKFMGMDTLVRDGKKQTWVTGDISCDRVIKKIEKNAITVDMPLNDSYDQQYTTIAVQKVQTAGQISQVGIEKFRIAAPAQSITINDAQYRAFTMGGITDGWAKDIEIFNTVNSISIDGKRITVDHVNIMHSVPTIGAAKPADLNGSGPQVLFNQCTITGDNVFFFATGAKVSGPVVMLNCIFKGNGWIQPHQRWATGVLADNCKVPDGGIDFMNRGSMGSGHGWAIGWAVAWNCIAKSYLNQQPPGAANWVIGSTGEHQYKAMPFQTAPFLSEGLYDSHGIPVNPSSLYLSQLEVRLGKQAVKNIGY